MADAGSGTGSGGLDLPDAQRILRRAVQLERAEGPVGGLSHSALEEAAAELGVQPSALAMALAEWRIGVTGGRAPLGQLLVGPNRITVIRSCSVSAAQASRLSGQWLERRHLLRLSEAGADVVVARRRRDPVATAGRAMRSMHGAGGLSKVREVRSAVGQLGDGPAALCLQADVSDSRAGAIATGCAIATVAVAGVGLGAVALSPLWLVAAPVALAAGVVVARRTHRRTVRRVQGCLEETSEAAARGNGPPSALFNFGRTVRRLRQR